MSTEPQQALPDRRTMLRGLGGAFATLLAPGVTLYAFGANDAQAQASPKVRWALLIDLGKCPAGCDLCVTACREENGWQGNGRAETDAQWIRKVRLRDARTGQDREVPVMCQHCDKPACVDVCPTGASFKRPDGIVLVDKHICIGCRFCMMACPYKARSFVHEPVTDQKPWAPRGKGTVEGCTLCVHRLDAGRPPACVETCAAKGGGAMLFGDLNDPGSEIAKAVARHAPAQIRSDLGLEPAVRYRNL
ncbi:sulfate reduction electron transfer complex DsrMKJOP subunit DsrO [Bradyrhizobium sp.]|uniref:sulfate reduction electron transfer complex DsrMKJOP subunit DsrO n=1 Tax=Bradyrhizobium sp. TaxID=376 RepID=UPI002606CF5B|nr:4Fe-4S dicluster domain-containing protein [Bradyrhizobium sp.]